MRSFLVLMLAVAACGDDSNHNQLPDAPTVDAPDAAATPVSLTVTKGAAPVAGVKVYFQNADSSLVLATTTDVNGLASAVMDAGGYVTAIDAMTEQILGGIARPTYLQTFANVKPGDHLVLHEDVSSATGTPVNVTFVMALEPTNTATRYEIETPCIRFVDVSGPAATGSGNPGGVVNLDGCQSTIDVLAVAYNQANTPIASIFLPNVAITDGGTVDLSDLATTPWVTTDVASWTYQNVPTDILSFDISSFQVTTRGLLYDMFQFNTVNAGVGTVADISRPHLPASTQVDFTRFSGPANASFDVLEWGAPIANYQITDLAAILPHEYTSQPVFDVATNSFTWTADTTGVAPNFVRAGMASTRNAGAFQWDWEIVDSAATTSIKLPTLPAPDDMFNALATDDSHQVQNLTTGHHPGGYDAVRAGLLSVSRFDTPLGLVVGASGQVVLEEMTFGVPAKPKRPRSPFAWKRARR